MDAQKLALAADGIPATPFEIPGATGGAFRIQLLNEDQGRGVVTSIVHIPPGGRIPAHRHRAGSEMHYVLDGDLVEAGKALPPGAFLTHAAGVVHGPHESRGGARVLTVQSWQSRDGGFDFEPAEGDEAASAEARMPAEAGAAGGQRSEGKMQKVDQAAQEEARRDESAPEARGYS
ncbi:cupin domain-containing protein [Falsiroseomonas sp. CW058]|uniref:cupin domain-containing protein n=1 Tax=Falsiroseomonas sp. CW058 TaxID=3388664 RepID=UPI003D32102A